MLKLNTKTNLIFTRLNAAINVVNIVIVVHNVIIFSKTYAKTILVG